MEVAGKVVVVTGAAGGIGRALVREFARHGVAGIAVADIDGPGAQKVAAELVAAGTPAIGVRCNVGDEADVKVLVAETEAAFGPVDIFCANAGIVIGGGVEVANEEWQRIWEVNVQSHIFAARAVLPSMLERGQGYLVHTASAAGLLTQLGSAPYSVTKHAVVALAEWLSITHGDAGVRVSCLCPQGVWTAMTGAPDQDGTTNSDEPGSPAGSGEVMEKDFATATAGRDGMMQPQEVARSVLAGIEREEFLILPHAEVASYEQRRAGDRERWLRGMRRLQASVFAPPS
jgi:NAD(P)-dependent dehydrogenase (short-subunit alcohol dehydrogenase family)